MDKRRLIFTGGLICFGLVFISACFVVVLPAFAAEARLPISATLIRCVTEAERQQNCSEKNLCCNLLESDESYLHRSDIKKRRVANNTLRQMTSPPTTSLEK